MTQIFVLQSIINVADERYGNFPHTLSKTKKERSFLLVRSSESTYLIQYDSNFIQISILLSCVRNRPQILLLILSD